MSKFDFATDDESTVFCENIIQVMIVLFGISKREALGRINKEGLRGETDFTGNHVFYHEDEFFWAKEIYFGRDSSWWINPQGLKPLPYP